MQNFHIITAKYLFWTHTKGNRIKIHSERFKETVIVSTNEYESGVKWCEANGFKILGTGFEKNRVVIVSTTFEPLKPVKPCAKK
jgi:hypothetical protein